MTVVLKVVRPVSTKLLAQVVYRNIISMGIIVINVGIVVWSVPVMNSVPSANRDIPILLGNAKFVLCPVTEGLLGVCFVILTTIRFNAKNVIMVTS